jgi:hypothetical protein
MSGYSCDWETLVFIPEKIHKQTSLFIWVWGCSWGIYMYSATLSQKTWFDVQIWSINSLWQTICVKLASMIKPVEISRHSTGNRELYFYHFLKPSKRVGVKELVEWTPRQIYHEMWALIYMYIFSSSPRPCCNSERSSWAEDWDNGDTDLWLQLKQSWGSTQLVAGGYSCTGGHQRDQTRASWRQSVQYCADPRYHTRT